MKISDAFQFLRDDLPKTRETQLVTRSAGVATAEGEVLLAMDLTGAPHVLIPHSNIVARHLSGALHMESSTYVDAGQDRSWMDIWCSDPRLSGVFERFAADVLDRLRDSDEAEGAVVRAFEEWKTLLHGSFPGLTRSQAVGLVGELELLADISHGAPVQALETWRGPEKNSRDFVSAASSIEVKTTEAREGGVIEIHGLGQLDPAGDLLWLAVFRVEEHPSGESIKDRVARLVSMGVPELGLLKKLHAAGYQESDPMGETTFRNSPPMVWEVTETFPGLRKAMLSAQARNAISGVAYSLSLAALPEPLSATGTTGILSTFGEA